MTSDYFKFKKFIIRQDKCAMKVGTDAVLLGAWVSTIPKIKLSLDIGTGTGIIAMMMAQKMTGKIFAIDIDKESIEQAKWNVSKSIFKSKIKIDHISLQELVKKKSPKFDLIVTNPPYFIDSLKSSTKPRNIARHNDFLSFEDLIIGVLKLLDSEGKFCLILPKNESLIFREMANEKGLYLNKLLKITPRLEKGIEKRHLMQFEFKARKFSEKTLAIESVSHRNYTAEYKKLTKDYYLNF